MTYRDEIRMIAQERQVPWLLHFTQVSNLPGIAEHGIRSRRDLARLGHGYRASSDYRLDDNNDAVSLSVSTVNTVMFASKREASGHNDWALLILAPDILWELECVFCWGNAATNEIRKHSGFRGGPWAFDRMFAGQPRINLPPSHQTDPAAEVQILQAIPPKYVRGAVVPREDLVGPVQALFEGSGCGQIPVEFMEF